MQYKTYAEWLSAKRLIEAIDVFILENPTVAMSRADVHTLRQILASKFRLDSLADAKTTFVMV